MVEPQAPPWIVRDTVEPQALAPDARNTAISWTGGKDCNLALLSAWRDPNLRVTSLVTFHPEDAVFRAHPLAHFGVADCLEEKLAAVCNGSQADARNQRPDLGWGT